MTIEAISTVMTSNMNTYYVKTVKGRDASHERSLCFPAESEGEETFVSKIAAASGTGKDGSGKGESTEDHNRITASVHQKEVPKPVTYNNTVAMREHFTKSVYEYKATDNAYKRRLAMEAYS